ncbi:hypothetical protein GCM10011507_06310 [Edaphobacter acidisoli]|uniref:NHL repeat containing protein n=1 Tax=Edaphobacter acidisoli TaxID=2040573 RepID=A0A916W0L2_9BACT|nr:hypothetical protein [Edaphobacter acidisoli]GGA57694.1 hypothetical protein GCM10011507_06310 [Edaphobacter acidisoli]
MNRNIFARLSGTQRSLVALLASAAMLTAGCANMATVPSNVDSLHSNATLSGKVHGGNQPVSGATVNLYFSGQADNSVATLAASTTTSNDGTGSFSFTANASSPDDGSTNTFSCPTNVGSPLVYVVAKGGNTLNNGDSSVNNSAAAFIAVYGLCDTLTNGSFVDMTELSTVATVAAVQQFFDPSNDSISFDGIGQEYHAVANIPNTIALMVNFSTGTGVNSTVIPAASGNGVSTVSVTATPEASKINTIADAISACVNNASSSANACNTLFASALPPSTSVTNPVSGANFPPATDVVQATYYILSNPTNGNTTNLQNIYTLATGVGAPYQPTLVTAPSDWTIAINYSSLSNCGTNSGGFISSPYDINIDGSDNVWIANSQASGNLSELTKAGAAGACVSLGNGGSNGSTIDTAGNVWLATASNHIYRYNPNGTVTDFPTSVAPLAVTADGLGNVYFTSSSTSSLYEIPGAATAATAVTPVQISSVVGPNPIRIMPDYQGNATQSNIWVSSGAGYVAEVSPGTSGPNPLNGFSTTTYPIGHDAYGLAVTSGGDVVVSSQGSDNYLIYLSKANSYNELWTSASGFGGINTPTGISLDGRGNIWVPNNTNVSGAIGSVSEVSANGTALSPAGGFQKSSSYFLSGRASAVDQVGNVWIVGDGANSITEVVGAGVPVYQPFSQGLSNGRFQTIP